MLFYLSKLVSIALYIELPPPMHVATHLDYKFYSKKKLIRSSLFGRLMSYNVLRHDYNNLQRLDAYCTCLTFCIYYDQTFMITITPLNTTDTCVLIKENNSSENNSYWYNCKYAN